MTLPARNRRLAFAVGLLALCPCAASAADGPGANTTQASSALIQSRLGALIGKWEAPTRAGTMVDTFEIVAGGSAVLNQEWQNEKQIDALIFYVVGDELRADEYCETGNQPRYAVASTDDGKGLNFIFKSATNLEANPVHAHSAEWKVIDAGHMAQDWHVLGGKAPFDIHLDFTKRD